MDITLVRIHGIESELALGHLEKSLEAVEHVFSVSIDRQAGRACVEHAGADESLLLRAVSRQGFGAELL